MRQSVASSVIIGQTARLPGGALARTAAERVAGRAARRLRPGAAGSERGPCWPWPHSCVSGRVVRAATVRSFNHIQNALSPRPAVRPPAIIAATKASRPPGRGGRYFSSALARYPTAERASGRGGCCARLQGAAIASRMVQGVAREEGGLLRPSELAAGRWAAEWGAHRNVMPHAEQSSSHRVQRAHWSQELSHGHGVLPLLSDWAQCKCC